MGVFIAIEGGDGSGQALELETHGLKAGYNVLRVGFPRYGELSARFIEHYLNGKYGSANKVHPELASMLYAVDRFAASEAIREHLRKPHSLVISDRYVASNLAHQGTKFRTRKARRTFYETILNLEYGTFDLPRPDINVVLLVPEKAALKNIDSKPTRTYTTAKRDEHEKDSEHLRLANENYRELTKLFPDYFVTVPTMLEDNASMRSVADIHEDIWGIALPLLHDRAG